MPHYRQGDTWPPLSGTVSDENGPVDIHLAALVEVHLKSLATLITGTVIVDDDGTLPLRGQWHYVPAINDWSIVGDYMSLIKVTWRTDTTPHEIETYSNNSANDPIVSVTASY
jgi:hypothetical protein